MPRDNRVKSFVFFGKSGCLLPSLIVFNLFFGRIFLKPMPWLISEAVLLLLFIISSYAITRKMASYSSRHDDAIDVKGEVLEDHQKIG
ncbi:MAG: hypothetical protein PHV44_05530 [Candidatus Omnitrophica bacterium]|nr:hypothetical protein [Candidatus Omnitrophota bacterium]